MLRRCHSFRRHLRRPAGCRGVFRARPETGPVGGHGQAPAHHQGGERDGEAESRDGRELHPAGGFAGDGTQTLRASGTRSRKREGGEEAGENGGREETGGGHGGDAEEPQALRREGTGLAGKPEDQGTQGIRQGGPEGFREASERNGLFPFDSRNPIPVTAFCVRHPECVAKIAARRWIPPCTGRQGHVVHRECE